MLNQDNGTYRVSMRFISLRAWSSYWFWHYL